MDTQGLNRSEAGNWTDWEYKTNKTYQYDYPSYDLIDHEELIAVQFVSKILDIALGVFLNTLLLVVVLSSPELRGTARNALIASMAAGDLVVTGVEQPLSMSAVYTLLKDGGCYLHIVLQTISDFGLFFVSLWGVVLLDVLFVLRLARVDLASIVTSSMSTSGWTWRRRLERVGVVVTALLPWLIALLVGVPVIFTGLSQTTSHVWQPSYCPVIITVSTFLWLFIVFLAVPAVLALVLLGVCLLVVLRRRRAGFVMSVAPSPTAPPDVSTQPSSTADGDLRPWPYVLGTLFTMLLMFPQYPLLLVSDPSKDIVETVITVLCDTKSTVLPLLWILAFPDLRARAKNVLCCACRAARRRAQDTSQLESTVSYRNLDASQT